MKKHGFRSFRRQLNAAFLAVSLIPLLLCSVLLVQIFRLRISADTQQAAQQQADQIVANARTLAEQEGKKIVAQANRDAVAIVEQAMDKLVADRTAQAYDAFLNSAEEGSGHAQQRS